MKQNGRPHDTSIVEGQRHLGESIPFGEPLSNWQNSMEIVRSQFRSSRELIPNRQAPGDYKYHRANSLRLIASAVQAKCPFQRVKWASCLKWERVPRSQWSLQGFRNDQVSRILEPHHLNGHTIGSELPATWELRNNLQLNRSRQWQLQDARIR